VFDFTLEGFLSLTGMVQEAQNIRSWLLNNRKISVPDDWLEACIEWIHSESEVTSGAQRSGADSADPMRVFIHCECKL